ncbi:MAG: DUF697 domain-containing protein [SAR324 cluster bacterium]|nr:DUF697 domain-containing protein [SAR324 cluster bacterium]
MSLPKKRKKLDVSSDDNVSPSQKNKPVAGNRNSKKPADEPPASSSLKSSQKPSVKRKSKNQASSPKTAATETELSQGFKLADNLEESSFASDEAANELDLSVPVISEKSLEKPAFPKDQNEQSLKASLITEKYVILAVGAGLIPAPFLDIVLASGIQVKLVGKLAKLYEKDFSPARAKYIITALGGNYAVGASSLWGVASLAKIFPFIGTIFGTATMPAALGAFTYAVGGVFSRYFELGGTLSDFDSSKNRAYFEKQLRDGQLRVNSGISQTGK